MPPFDAKTAFRTPRGPPEPASPASVWASLCITATPRGQQSHGMAPRLFSPSRNRRLSSTFLSAKEPGANKLFNRLVHVKINGQSGGDSHVKTVATPRSARAPGLFLALGLLCLGTVSGPVHAEGEATNPAVRERMALMKDIGRNLKSIADMVQQKAPFEGQAAQAAAGTIAADAERIPAVFKPRESDPASEALPVIWEKWDDFVAHADKLASAAKAIDATSAETLAAGFRPMAGACKSCHDSYRMDD